MATKSRKQTAKRTRSGRARRASGKQAGRKGLLNRITGRLGRSGRRGSNKGGGVASNVSGFVRGFLDGGSSRRRRR
jgi:hypothetical protein